MSGVEQAGRLAVALQAFAPTRLMSSPEPKAARTSEILSAALKLPMTLVEDFRELDRPEMPILTQEEHERVNARVFADFGRRVLGNESAREARDRFTAAVRREAPRAGDGPLVVVAHGTVIALLVGGHNAIDPFDLWKRLRCPSFAVVDATTLALIEVVARMP